jgi:hypothetical protein
LKYGGLQALKPNASHLLQRQRRLGIRPILRQPIDGNGLYSEIVGPLRYRISREISDDIVRGDGYKHDLSTFMGTNIADGTGNATESLRTPDPCPRTAIESNRGRPRTSRGPSTPSRSRIAFQILVQVCGASGVRARSV